MGDPLSAGVRMINASSSIASSFLSQYFGTSNSNSTASSGLGLDDSTSSPDYLLDGSLGSDNFSADFLSNAVFAQDTESLLLNPHLNGAIGGTASTNVQKIIQQIEGSLGISTSSPTSTTAASSTASTTPTTTADSTTSTLPAGGVVA
jgi:hypothetical protein